MCIRDRFARNLKKIKGEIIGFDSFKGLKDEWMTEAFNPIGTFDLKGKKPKVYKNVKLIDGWVEETLGNFISNNNKKVAFLHLDLDTYSGTKSALQNFFPLVSKGGVVIFDEYGSRGWGESEAIDEYFKEKKYKIQKTKNSSKPTAFLIKK